MKKYLPFKKQEKCLNMRSQDDGWVFLSSGASSGEEFSQLSISPSPENQQTSNTSVTQKHSRSNTSDGVYSAGCSQSCKDTISLQRTTIYQLTKSNKTLTEQIDQLIKRNHDLEERLRSPGSTLQIAQSSQTFTSNAVRKENPGIQRPNSDSVLIHMTVEDLNFFSSGMERSKKHPRKRPNSKRRKASKDPPAPAEFEITFEDEQMNKLQSALSSQIYGDDIFLLYRYFHPNPDPFISDLRKTSDSSRERLHLVFADLKKLGYKKFNPVLIHKYFVKLEQLKFAQLVEPFLSDKEQSNQDLPQSSKDL